MVENVIGFGAELSLEALVKLEVLEYRDVEVIASRPTEDVLWRIAQSTHGGQCECGRIHVHCKGALILGQHGDTDNIRPRGVGRGSGYVVGIARLSAEPNT